MGRRNKVPGGRGVSAVHDGAFARKSKLRNPVDTQSTWKAGWIGLREPEGLNGVP